VSKARAGERRKREMNARRGRDRAMVAKDIAITGEGGICFEFLFFFFFLSDREKGGVKRQ